jgi:hypothetical protein
MRDGIGTAASEDAVENAREPVRGWLVETANRYPG